MIPVSERVAAGAAFLDENDTGWWREDAEPAIDLDTLCLADPRQCVLGQRCPLEMARLSGSPYAVQRQRLTGMGFDDTAAAWAQQHGFSLSYREAGPADWDDLTLAWHVLISERRKLAAEGESS